MTLTFDAFGVLDVRYKMSDEGLKRLASVGVTSPNPVISTTGRVVIDTQQHRITYIGDDFEERALGFDPKLAAQRANPFALERIRYYEFRADGTLMLSTKYENGKESGREPLETRRVAFEEITFTTQIRPVSAGLTLYFSLI